MKRTLYRIPLVMLLGAVTSIVVAWGCSMRLNHFNVQGDVRVFRVDGGERGPWRFSASRMMGCETIYSGVGYLTGHEPPPTDVPWWSVADYSPDLLASARPGALENRVETAFGWPVVALHTFSNVDNGIQSWTTAWAAPSPTNRPYVLPYRPIWRGMLANTLGFGALWWAMLLGPGKVKRLLRRRGGRCTKCNYKLRGLEKDLCPECGESVQVRSRTPRGTRSRDQE